ncbi:MAG: glycosyl hydrolase [Lewinellaceae bacterium]|nr:glycosyl hydrolase [Lewinellaceae bacterium]
MTSRIVTIALTCLLGGVTTPWAEAQSSSSLPSPAVAEYWEGMIFRDLGPARGGRSTAVCGHPSDLFTYYFGATGGGVWKTTDGGLSWANISDGFIPTGSIGAIAVADSDPNVIYVGTGAADVRGNVSPGRGIYRSTDAGLTWLPIGLPKAGQIAKIQVHPLNPELVYVAVLGNIFGPNPERGVYRSADGGQTWQQVLYVSERTGAVELVMDPQNPRILYAGMWSVERKPWTLIDGSSEGGVWKSTDGGDNWVRLDGGLPSGLVGRVGIAVAPTNPNRVWVLQEAADETKGGLYRSEDGGKTFQRINRDHNLRQRAWYYSRIYVDPQDENTVYVMNVNFLKSIDGGKTFTRVRVPHGDTHALWINPEHPQMMINGNDGGACITVNGGATWSSQLNQPTAEIYRLTVDQQFPYRVYGAQQDNTTISVPSRTQGGLSPMEEWYGVGGGESGHIAVDPRNPNLIYAGNYIGQITRLERDKGHAKDVVAYPQMHDGQAGRDIRYRFQWNAPIRLSPHNPDVIYHCSQYVHRSTDGGRNWEVISPDLTTNNDAYQDIPGGPIQHDHTGVELFTTIFAFEESPLKAGELWVGSDDGLVHLSRDNGKTWTNITPKGMPANATVNAIELSPHAPGRAFIAVHKYRENDYRPYIFATTDYGKTWQLLTSGTNGIPADHFVRVVREDPQRQGLLYAGTEYGLFVSWDGGKSWLPFQRNLPITPITDAQVVGQDLVLATQGRGFWLLDDLTPLRSWSPATAAASAHLFTPAIAYRTQLSNNRGASAPDPAPNGAIIYFNIKDPATAGAVHLAILDQEGKVRRVFASQPDSDKTEEHLEVHAGLNRMVWDLRYEEPQPQPGAVFSLANLDGIQAPTGIHTVELTVGDKVFRESLALRPDPRWTVSDDDLAQQYLLTMDVKELFNSCHTLIGDLRDLRQQANEARQRAIRLNKLDAPLKETLNELIETLDSLEQELIQTRSEAGQDPINYPSKIDDQIAYLYSVLNGSDDRPTSGAYERFEDLKLALVPRESAWRRLKQVQLPALNQILAERGIQVVGPLH